MTIAEITRDLAEARADVALLTRLHGAEKRVAQLERAHATALAAQQEDASKQAEIDREASYEGVTAIRVAAVSTQHGPVPFPHTPFDVTYTQPAWDMYAKQSLPKEHVVRGFAALPRGAMLFLLERAPEQIPPQIMALAPNDPASAMGAYFAARKRGHL